MVVFVALIGWFYDAMRKRVQETLEEAQKDLERRVSERTTALQRLNEQLGTEVAERKEAEKALRVSETQTAYDHGHRSNGVTHLSGHAVLLCQCCDGGPQRLYPGGAVGHAFSGS